MLTFSIVYLFRWRHIEKGTFPKSVFDDAELQENALSQRLSFAMMRDQKILSRNILSHCESFSWRRGNILKFGKR